MYIYSSLHPKLCLMFVGEGCKDFAVISDSSQVSTPLLATLSIDGCLSILAAETNNSWALCH